MRLDKFLSHTGFGSRKEVKSLIKKKVVAVNSVLARDGKQAISEETDIITVDGEVISYEKDVYYLLNKPQGVISATEDRDHRTVIDLLRPEDFKEGVFPVGRLDKDTTGLLVLTTDGQLAHDLLSPKKHVPKTYAATIQGIVTKEDQEAFAEGLVISGGEQCQPAELIILSVTEELMQSEILVTISEGKYHQVKRMFQAVGKKVTRLHRQSMGNLVLNAELANGDYRKLTAVELEGLRKGKN